MTNSVNKLVFVGNMGAGKTTAIHSISDLAPVSTEMPISHDLDSENSDKTSTTVALDYSSIETDDGQLLHIYGVPGQKYLDFMWPIVCDGALGIIILANASRDNIYNETLDLLREFSALAPKASIAVGITMTDLNKAFTVSQFREALAIEGFNIPIMAVDARSSMQVTFLLKSLLSYRLVSHLAS